MAESSPPGKESDSLPLRASFELISSGAGPRTCAHACATSGRRVFIHGGKSSADPSAKDVKNDLWIFHVDDRRWEDVTDDHSPFLSQHCAVLSDTSAVARFFLIGGWDGRHRTSDLFSFRLDSMKWEKWTTSGFPVGAGLTSFAVVPIATVKTGKTATSTSASSSSSPPSIVKRKSSASSEKEMFLVCGREGGLRTQRRSGNAYLLSCDLQKNQSVYEPFPRGTASRSGHTATGLGETSKVVLIGGRDDALVEVVEGVKPKGGWGGGGGGSAAAAGDGQVNDDHNNLLQKIRNLTPMKKAPPTRQRHIAIPIGNTAILIHGGETYDGKSKTPVADVFLVWFDSAPSCKSAVVPKWFKMDCGHSSPHLAAHSAAIVGWKELIIFGGFQSMTAVNSCYRMNLF